jgi:hypothetical protein
MNLLDDKLDDQIQTPQVDSYFEELTKPGGKFDLSKYDGDKLKAAEAISKGKYEGDHYIDHFKARHDELRQDYSSLREQVNAGPKLQELIDRYQSASQNNNQSNIPQDDDVKPVSFDPSKIEELLEQKLTAREQLRREEANFKTVESKLTEHYGSDYQRVLKQQVDNLGLDKDFVNELARKHPQVLFRTLGLEGQKQDNAFQSPMQSSQRQDPFAPKTKRTNAYYQKLRKDQPEVYRSPKIQDQMYKDALELGDDFNDGDWNAYGHRY